MQELRTVQREALSKLKEVSFRGTVVLPTGVGKSRIGVEVVRQLPTASTVLVVVPKINLKGQWKKEMEINGVSVANVEFQCINTAFKLNQHYDLVIVDECHRTLSPVFRQMYTSLTYKYLVCLTATEPREPEYKDFLYSVAPLVFKRDLSHSLEEGVVSPYKIYNIPSPMSKEVLYKYNAFNKQFSEGVIGISRLRNYSQYLKSNFGSAFDIARHFTKFPNSCPSEIAPIMGELLNYVRLFWTGMSMRKQQLYSNPSKIPMVKTLVDTWSDKKWIIFTKTIKMAQQISDAIPGSRVYHSKLKDGERDAILEEFAAKKFRVLVSIDALNEGLNVQDVDAAVTVSGSSTELEQIQRLGRCIRKVEGKVALFINLYVPGTPEENWVRERTKTLNPTWVDSVHKIKP